MNDMLIFTLVLFFLLLFVFPFTEVYDFADRGHLAGRNFNKILAQAFRYFQRFAGRIQLPDRFQPRRVTIRLSPRGKGQPAGVEQTLEWPA